MRETGAWVGWEVSVAGMGHGTMMMRWHVHGQRKELRLPGNLGALGEAVHSQPKLKAACGAHWMHLMDCTDLYLREAVGGSADRASGNWKEERAALDYPIAPAYVCEFAGEWVAVSGGWESVYTMNVSACMARRMTQTVSLQKTKLYS
eukprot:scaffold57907_cov20-Tisochrysis_lutea.AAC.1